MVIIINTSFVAQTSWEAASNAFQLLSNSFDHRNSFDFMDDCIKCLINWNNCLHADLNYSFVHYRDRMRSSRVAVTCGGLSLVGACQRALWLVETDGQDDGNYRAGVIGLFVCFDRPDSQCFSKSTPDCRAPQYVQAVCPFNFETKQPALVFALNKLFLLYFIEVLDGLTNGFSNNCRFPIFL